MSTMLLSIKPKYAKVILEGKKQYEFRKNKPKDGVTRIIFYASSPQKLKDVVVYDTPKELSDYGIRQAPQSFVYLD